jgi:hypothetical protein
MKSSIIVFRHPYKKSGYDQITEMVWDVISSRVKHTRNLSHTILTRTKMKEKKMVPSASVIALHEIAMH